jgi:uncharacterized protein (TIGR04255 family)
MEPTKKYKNPPIIEAVFELFYESSNWSSVIPGIFYNKIDNNYPKISQVQKGVGISVGNKGIQIAPGLNDMTQFKSLDDSSIIQLSSGLLTVNKLPKYNGWDNYKKNILDAVEAFKQVVKIDKCTRVGLKTINKIDIGEHSFHHFRQHFNVYPHIPDGIINDLNSIQLTLESPLDNKTEIQALTFSTLKREPEYSAPTLFQIYFTKIKDVDLTSLENWLESAHESIHNSFEKSLTEECKKCFDNV